jgi:membrane protein YdbS with pleckstrin-like domain
VKRLLLILWLIASALLLLLTIALSYMSLMMGAVHWDWWLSAGLGICFLAIAVGSFWMCRRGYGLLDARKGR